MTSSLFHPPRKVLQVNKFYHLKGGSESYLFGLEESLRALGHECAQFAMSHAKNTPSLWSEFFVDEVDYRSGIGLYSKIKIASKILYSFEASRKISRVIDIFKPDLAHLHLFQHQISPSILPVLKNKNIPIIYTAHDLKSACPSYKMLAPDGVCERCKSTKYYNCLIHKCTMGSYAKSAVNMMEMYLHSVLGLYNLIDYVVTPSEFYRKKLIEWRFPVDKVEHVPNFIDAANFHPHYENDGYALFFGRLSEEKGLLTLIKAMRQVPSLQLVIAGTGPIENEIREFLTENRMSNVKLVGFQSGESLRSLIQKSMFTVLPSEWYENGPMSLIESFAYGKPVLGARIGGIPEHIDDGVNGYSFTAGDAEDLAQKLELLSSHSTSLSEMGREARGKAERCYSKEIHMDRILGIYSKFTGKGLTA